MKSKLLLLGLVVLLAACGPSGSDQVPVAELPDPAIYALDLAELPDVGMAWQETYNQSTTQEGYRWSYRAYQVYQPGNLGVELASAFAVNNDVILYEVDMHQADLPQPPSAMGNIQNIAWKTVSQTHRLGDKSAMWKTTMGDLLTPVWWLEFYQGHAYVRISLLGFPDQLASPFLYEMGDSVAKRLPRSVSRLRSDAGTQVATPTAQPTATLLAPVPSLSPTSISGSGTVPGAGLKVVGYSAPPGETGMVAFKDDTGSQLADGRLGDNDLLADLGSGTAYEWVGWTDQTEPVTLTFRVDGEIGAVQIGFNHREGLGVFVPSSVTINGMDFALEAEAVPNNQRADLTFQGPFQGPEVQVVLHHRGRGWMMVDEVKFLAVDK